MAKEEVDPTVAVARFLRRAANLDDTIYVAIDPGSTGAIGFLCGRVYCVIDIPVIVTKVSRTKKTSAKERRETGRKTKTVVGSTTKFNFGGICAIFSLLRPHKDRIIVVLEAVPTSLGPGKAHGEAMLNRAYAMWPLFLFSKNYELEEPTPGVWKKKMGLAGKDKEASRLKALSLFPKADILRKKDHDRAEALLMAEFCRRQRSNKL